MYNIIILIQYFKFLQNAKIQRKLIQEHNENVPSRQFDVLMRRVIIPAQKWIKHNVAKTID